MYKKSNGTKQEKKIDDEENELTVLSFECALI